MQGKVYFGAVDSRNQRKMHYLSEILMPQNKDMTFSLDTLRQLNRERKSRQQKIKISKRSIIENAAKNYMEVVINYFENPEECSRKLECMNTTSNTNFESCQEIKC